jgi:hypothetical protein
MADFRPIETSYHGYVFRSRLEARWAVFFEKLGLKFEYEREGFELGGPRYLPDFYLPDIGFWAEVKPLLPQADGILASYTTLNALTDLTPLERAGIPIQMLERFTRGVAPILCLVGQPQAGFILSFLRDDDDQVLCFISDGFAECPFCFRLALYRTRPESMVPVEKQRRCPIGCNRVSKPEFFNVDWAAGEARSARFEHGQSGGPSDWNR